MHVRAASEGGPAGRDGGILRRMVNLIIFVVGSAGILFVSRGSLRAGADGLYQPAALELLLILALLQGTHWFEAPLSAPQAVSGLLLALAVALGAAAWLGKQPNGSAPGRGIYRAIRQPAYAALLCFGWGVLCQGLARVDNLVFLGACLLTCATLLLIAAARTRETELYLRWGAEYGDYLKSTKMFIPFLF
jgi:protein-S-isoprenylcysteine O-methyltransferase Ste14